MATWITRTNARPEGQEIARTDETYTVGAHEPNYVLPHGLALEESPSSVVVKRASDDTHLTEVAGAPAQGEYRVLYDPDQALGGAFEFNALDDALAVKLSYKDRGSLIWAHVINDLQATKLDDAFASIADATGAVQFSAAAGDALRVEGLDGILVTFDPLTKSIKVSNWTPASVEGLAIWLKADALALADGDPVGEWTDQSGNDRHATQSTTAKKPTFQAGELAGRPVVRFDGVDDYLNTAYAPTGQFTLFLVRRIAVLDTNLRFILSCQKSVNPDGGFDYTAYNSGGGLQDDLLFRTGLGTGPYPSGVNEKDTIPLDTAWVLTTIRIGASASELWHGSTRLINDTAHGAIATGDPLRLGANQDAENQYFDGDMAEFLFFTRALSEAEREKVLDHLAAKYGLTV